MRKKTLWTLLALAGVMMLFPGCDWFCPECPEEEVSSSIDDSGPSSPPGPIIIIDADPSDPSIPIIFEVDSTAQTDGGSAATSLREDFIGLYSLVFTCTYTNDAGDVMEADAKHIQAKDSGGNTLNIKRTSSAALDWYIESSTGGTTTLFSDGATGTGAVPTEFMSLQRDSLKDVELGVDCSKVRLQVQLK